MKQIEKQLYKTKKRNVTQNQVITNVKHANNHVNNHKTHKYFLPHARLNRGQRRFCHCIMKARVSKNDNSHYGFCRGIAKNDWAKAKKMRSKTKARQYYFDINKTNCIMNYDYNDYSLREIQAFVAEKGLPLFELDNTGTEKYYTKDRLVQILVTNYIKKHQSTKKRKINLGNTSNTGKTKFYASEKKTKKHKLKQ